MSKITFWIQQQQIVLKEQAKERFGTNFNRVPFISQIDGLVNESNLFSTTSLEQKEKISIHVCLAQQLAAKRGTTSN